MINLKEIEARFEAGKKGGFEERYEFSVSAITDIPALLEEVKWLRGLIITALPHLKHRGWYSKAREILEEALEQEE